MTRSVRVAERLALPTSDHGVAGSNPAGGEILPEPKRRFIAQSLSCSPFHRLEMTEILLKWRKTLTHPSIHQQWLLWFVYITYFKQWVLRMNINERGSNGRVKLIYQYRRLRVHCNIVQTYMHSIFSNTVTDIATCWKMSILPRDCRLLQRTLSYVNVRFR